MKITLYLVCFSLFFFSCQTKCLNSLMIGYKIRYGGQKIYNRLCKDPKFTVYTTMTEFKEKGEFEALLLEQSKVYPNADSLHIKFSYGTDEDINHKVRRLKVVSVVEYLKDKGMVLPELERLKNEVCSSFRFEHSPFNNGDGFVEVGINSDPIPYPALELVPSMPDEKTHQIEVLIMDIDY